MRGKISITDWARLVGDFMIDCVQFKSIEMREKSLEHSKSGH